MHLVSSKPFTTVDLFAGAGGWSTGARRAGARVLMALNHWPTAVETHSANHPDTKHACQDLTLFDHSQLPDCDLLIASPSCVGHTRARGKERKHHDATRATAWCVIDAIEAKRPEQFVVENVVEFQTRWELYGIWRMALSALGYDVREHILNAAEWGVPQERVRLIVTGRRGGRATELVTPHLPGAPAVDIIDWRAGKWGSTEGRAQRTTEVIADGRARGWTRFLVPYFGNTHVARDINRPIGTITCKDRYGIVDGNRYRMVSVAEAKRAMDFPTDYQLRGTQEDQMKLLGNAVCVGFAQRIVEQLCASA